MKKGINAWCLPSHLNVEEIFKLAKDAGFESIELNLTEANPDMKLTDDLGLVDNPILTLDTSKGELENILKVSAKYQLPISSISTGLHWTYPLNHHEVEVRQKGKEIVRKMIDICATLGGDTVLVVPGLVTEWHEYETCYKLAKEAFIELGVYAEAKNITIGVENVWNKFLLSPLEMRQFIDEINHSFVKVYFDAGNVLQFGFPEQWVRILGDKIAKIHIKDFNCSIGNIQGFTNLLNGDMNWEALIHSLKEIDYRKEIICELAPYKTNPAGLAYDTSKAMDYILNLK